MEIQLSMILKILNLEDIIVPDKCPLLECDFVVGQKYAYPYTHSLDRINNEKGYIKGNVQVVCFKAKRFHSSLKLLSVTV